jgi:hypothetical protein
MFVALNVPATVAAELLGHDPVVYARTYLHSYEDDKRAATAQLGAALSGGAS